MEFLVRGGMELFIHRQNLLRYAEMLDGEHDPAMREQLRILLIEEEDRFGLRRERLGNLDELIVHSRHRIRIQERVVADQTLDHAGAARAQSVLANMRATLALLNDHRGRLEDGCDSFDP